MSVFLHPAACYLILTPLHCHCLAHIPSVGPLLRVYSQKQIATHQTIIEHRGPLNAERSSQFSTSSMSPCFQISVRKLHAEKSNGDPMKWIKWNSIFKATIDHSTISSAEKMVHLQSLLTREA